MSTRPEFLTRFIKPKRRGRRGGLSDIFVNDWLYLSTRPYCLWEMRVVTAARGVGEDSEKALEILAEEFVTTEKNKAYV